MDRMERARRACADEGLDALYVRDVTNIRWLTGFDGVFDEEQAHALFLSKDKAQLHTDSRYAAACERAAAGTPVSVNTSRRTHAAWLVACHLGEAQDVALGIEDGMTLREFRALERELAPLREASGTGAPQVADVRETRDLVCSLRAVKDPDEIRRMRAAQEVTDAAFAHITGFMRPGMTEREVQIELEDFMRRHGAEGLAFSSIVACGANGASPHAVPGDARLQAGQCVVMDFGAKRAGYCSDMTRVVFLGQPDERLRDAYAVLREANERVEAAIRPGVTGVAMHELAEQVLADGGYGGRMGHGLGHGVGLVVHEEPCLNTRNAEPLVPGNVVTVEPGIYLEGEFGMRLEDFGVVTEDGFDVFTQSTHEMVIV